METRRFDQPLSLPEGVTFLSQRTKLAVHCDSWWGVGLSEASDDEGMGDHDLVGAEGPGHE